MLNRFITKQWKSSKSGVNLMQKRKYAYTHLYIFFKFYKGLLCAISFLRYLQREFKLQRRATSIALNIAHKYTVPLWLKSRVISRRLFSPYDYNICVQLYYQCAPLYNLNSLCISSREEISKSWIRLYYSIYDQRALLNISLKGPWFLYIRWLLIKLCARMM